MKLRTLALAIVCLIPAIAVGDPLLESRVERLERILSQQSLSDVLMQVQRLQQEVQTLRGQVEVQQHELNALKQQGSGPHPGLDPGIGADDAPGTGQAAAGSASGSTTLSTPVPAATAVAASGAGEQEAYDAAFDLLKQRNYDEAIRAFQDVIVRWPSGDLTDNAHYWLGETYYVKRDYPAALSEFQRVLFEYPASPKVPGAMLKAGYVHYDQGDWAAARAALQDVIAKFPETTESRLAQSRLDRMAKDGR